MARTDKLPFRTLILLTTLPSVLIGALFWYLSTLIPACTVDIAQRLTSPEGQFDLVAFSRDCGAENTQAALIPAGDDIADDAAAFFAAATKIDLAPRWTDLGQIELTVPSGTKIDRQDDTVAGYDVIYR